MVEARDGHLASSTTIQLEVTNTNRAPRLIPMPPQYVREGDVLEFHLTAVDLDGDASRYEVVSGLPAGAALDSRSGRFRWTPRFDQAGEYRVLVRAEDTGAAGEPREFVLHVQDVNRAPQIDVTDHAVQLGQTLAFTVKANDPDPGDSLTYSATNLPQGASLDPGTGGFTWTPGPGQLGEQIVVFSVTDGQATTSRSITLEAAVQPEAPNVTLVLTPSFPVLPGELVLIHAIADSRTDRKPRAVGQWAGG